MSILARQYLNRLPMYMRYRHYILGGFIGCYVAYKLKKEIGERSSLKNFFDVYLPPDPDDLTKYSTSKTDAYQNRMIAKEFRDSIKTQRAIVKRQMMIEADQIEAKLKLEKLGT